MLILSYLASLYWPVEKFASSARAWCSMTIGGSVCVQVLINPPTCASLEYTLCVADSCPIKLCHSIGLCVLLSVKGIDIWEISIFARHRTSNNLTKTSARG
jgi:hypothetical protein